jgi:hypothetical protein
MPDHLPSFFAAARMYSLPPAILSMETSNGPVYLVPVLVGSETVEPVRMLLLSTV